MSICIEKNKIESYNKTDSCLLTTYWSYFI